MKSIERYNQYSQHSLDDIMQLIRSGKIKCGRYSHLVKINKNKIIKDKELFTNGTNGSGKESNKYPTKSK